MFRTKSYSFIGGIVVLAFLAGCSTNYPMLTSPNPSVVPTQINATSPETYPPITDSAKTELIELIAQTIAPQFVDNRDYLIVYTIVKDETDLYFGNSTRESDVQRCWVYSQAHISECTPNDFQRAFRPSQAISSMPKIFFAIASADSHKVLVILDNYNGLSTSDIVDGFRIVFEYKNNTWQEISRTQVY